MVQSLALRYISTATQTDPLDLRVTEIELASQYREEGIKLVTVEFLNSKLVKDDGIQQANVWEYLGQLPEPYEISPMGAGQEKVLSAEGSVEEPRTSEAECGRRDIDEPQTPEALHVPATVVSSPKTPVIPMPDKQPSCPQCEARFTRMLGLIDHLKRVHGQRKIIFRCAKCGKQNLRYHSISCHIPRCKGTTCVAPTGEWVCEVCHRGFATKIGLGQHKRIRHPLVRNLERIAASQPKVPSARGAHRRVWSEEEEALLMQLVEKYNGKRNINQLIAEHIPTKTAKQISDKRRILAKHLVVRDQEDPAGDVETEHLSEPVHSPKEGHLKQHYRNLIKTGLSVGKFTMYREAFEKFVNGQDPGCVVNDVYNEFLGILGEPKQNTSMGRSRKKKVHDQKSGKTPNWMSKRAIKKGKFLRFQYLFKIHRRRLARIILDSTEALQCQIPSNDVHDHFKARWDTSGIFSGLSNFPPYKEVNNMVFEALITDKEVEKNVKEMCKTSAPGPDGFTLGQISAKDPKFSRLTEIFNLWLVTGTIPDALRDCRTVLIPKSSDAERLGDINNWRPITIGSVVIRLFSRIATARLSQACPINPRQRGFIRASGCAENLKLLQLVVKTAKREHKHLGVVFVDIAKAFDTVSHQHVFEGLVQRGVDSHVIELVREMYRDVRTCISVGKGKTDPIYIRSGVKQGDPMSPLLFNLAMDPLLCKLENGGKGFHHGDWKTTAMAFADDLVLLSDSWDGMCHNIKILETFCNLTGLNTKGEKCHGFYIKPTKDSYTINECPAWVINGSPLNMIDPGCSERYLGTWVDPWITFADPRLSEKLTDWLQRIGRSPLKPLQKVDILRTYTIPRMIYLADHTEVKVSLLESLDQLIRNTVKEWLHLPQSTCDAILYSSFKDGGLGLIRLVALIPSIQARRLHRLAQSSDETLVNYLKDIHLERLFESLWLKAGGSRESIPSIWEPLPMVDLGDNDEARLEWEAPTPKISYPKPCNWRKLEFQKWTRLVSQGHGIENFENDEISNAWLRRFGGIPHRKLITALQLRANVYPTREFLARGRHENFVQSCRHCGATLETTAHIVGNCATTQEARIKRHNAICEALSEVAKREGWIVYEEPHLRDEVNELFKPDLIFVKGSKAVVVDVTVRYEHSDTSLKEAASEKARKYQRLQKQIEELTNVKDIEYVGFPMGARGKWYGKNTELLTALGLSKTRLERTARALASKVLFASVDIVHLFVSKARST
uniref:Reverse transcriptase n=1 Tax=Junco hyemalis TaxID=40217 RepID=A0A8C5JJ73_JUNHY